MHPLLVRVEENSAREQSGKGGAANVALSCCNTTTVRKAVLQAAANYQPKETILEAFSVGNVKVGEHQVDKTSRLTNRDYGDCALQAMNNM